MAASARNSRGLRPYRLLNAEEKLKGLAYPTRWAMADKVASLRSRRSAAIANLHWVT